MLLLFLNKQNRFEINRREIRFLSIHQSFVEAFLSLVCFLQNPRSLS